MLYSLWLVTGLLYESVQQDFETRLSVAVEARQDRNPLLALGPCLHSEKKKILY
jgi:hypothetical protein